MDKISYVGNADVNAIDHLYKMYQQDPESVDIGWKRFFEGFEFSKTSYDTDNEVPENFQKELKVLNLINGYRTRGHLFTKTNPVRERRHYNPTLALAEFGLDDKELDTVFKAGEEVGLGAVTLRQIVDHLEKTYCQSIGIEFMYMREPHMIKWMLNAIELTNRPTFSKEQKTEIYKKLMQASGFEAFLGKKFVGQKRFSVEGLEALIPALDALIKKGSELGVEHFVMGMAHRGRLNTLANIFEKRPRDIFAEFEGKEFDFNEEFDGDVKYHQGYTSSVEKNGKKISLTLSPNPSHLEAVNPVVEGLSRAKLDLKYNNDLSKVCPVLMHGDAAVAGQGVVYETVQMAGLDGYNAGGTIHIVTNNQVGFTTNYLDGRTSTYCTDVAKTTLSPVFHVNADDVEAVIQVIEIAMAYRQEFKKDIFIDLLGYRKYGHNEGDEPKFTQPSLYSIISKHKNPSDLYLDKLIPESKLSKEEASNYLAAYQEFLESEYAESAKMTKATVYDFMQEEWKDLTRAVKTDFETSPETGVAKDTLLELGRKLATLPEGKKYFRKIEKIFKDRLAAIEGDKLDWGSAEMLAYATLLEEGHPVRISGQDVERGTFSHRHAVVKTDDDSEEEVVTLNLLSDKQAPFNIYNSFLSEYAVLGFEYGYSMATPNALTIWEAQFGDFFNGAQIMVDQFITAGEDKWSTQSGLVMLLPHGYEGQGAEHSSGRMERFLQQSADLNIQVINTSTPANHFHLLRRQMKRNFRKPMVVFSPKMLLRYPSAVSTLDELASGRFQEVIDDPNAKVGTVDTVVLVSGKFYYEASEKAAEMGVDNMAFVRVEQLYPFPAKQIDAVLAKYNAKNVVWAQEEPENMGAWQYMAMKMRDKNINGVTRPESAAAAEGSKELHLKRLAALWKNLFQFAKVKA